MKRVLITGANSFLGDNTKKYLEEHGDYQVDILDMLDENWRKTDFSKYDVVFNVCAIVHRPKEKDTSLYYKVNRDLAVEIANKAKDSGVKQFIQTSTDGVFGVDVGLMSQEKGFNPKTDYEKSKFEADCLLESMRTDSFKVCIIRPPLMYGVNCKGNFPKLVRFAKKFPVFPSIKNKKDFIYVENIADFIKFSIENGLNEICYPRDSQPIAVSYMVQTIARYNKKKIHLWSIFNPFVKLFRKSSHTLRLVFCDNFFAGNICSLSWTPPFLFEEAIEKMYGRIDN